MYKMSKYKQNDKGHLAVGSIEAIARLTVSPASCL